MRGGGKVPSGSMARTATSDDSQRSAKWKARRDAIIDTSARVFARGGYHATGIAELCEVNGLGKGAFYYYIESKEELLAAIHDRVMDEVMLGADRVAQAGGSPSAQLAMLGDELLDVIHRYPDHVWVFLHEFPALTAERADQFRVRRRDYERRVEAVLQAGIDSGEFRDVEPWLTARVARHAQLHVPVAQGGRPRVGSRRGETVRRHLHPRDRQPNRLSAGLTASLQETGAQETGTGASNPRSPPRVPPIMAAFSSAGTSRNSLSMSSRLPRNVPSACG